jgi:hypothetical protein
MSEHTSEPDATGTGPGETVGILGRTRFAIATALGRRDSRAVFGLVMLVYTLGYLGAVQELRPGGFGYDVRVAGDPLSKLFQPSTSAVNFEPIVLVQTEFFTYLFSLNTLIGVGLGVLVGLNLAITYLAWRQPAACGLGTSSAGLLAGVPAILSGSACCGPILVIVLGVQATGIFAPAVFAFLLPAAVVLLIGTLLLIGRRIDPALVGEADSPA